MNSLPIRGGNWNNQGNAGPFALNLNNPRSNSNSNIGFRPALLYRQMCGSHGSCTGTRRKGNSSPSLSELKAGKTSTNLGGE